MKKISIVIILGIIGVSCFFLFSGNEGFSLKIVNHTNKKITGLILTTPKGDIKIPKILQDEVYKLKVMPSSDGSGSIYLQYKVEEGGAQTIGINGLTNKKYHGKAEIVFKTIDESGTISVESSSSISNYNFFD